LIGTYETFEAISRQISMKYHRDFLVSYKIVPSDKEFNF